MSVVITVPELAKEMHKDAAKLYEWAARKVDPMPVRYVDGERYGSVLVSEFESWFKRNTALYSERRRNGG